MGDSRRLSPLKCCYLKDGLGTVNTILNAAWDLPMDELGSARAEGLLQGHNSYGTGFTFYHLPSYYWPSGIEPSPGSDEYWAGYWGAFYLMTEHMLSFWGIIGELETIYANGHSCAQEKGLPYPGANCPDVL